jgi:uncharacterized protein (DUF427 family)
MSLECEQEVVGMAVRTEPCERWVRAYVGATTVVDSRAPLLFWETKFPVPSYAFATSDVRMDLLQPAAGEPPTQPWFSLPQGPVTQWFDLTVGDRLLPHAAWIRDERKLADRVIFSWQEGLIDRWTEEDEEVAGHPRDPHHRVDALPSSRHITVSVDGKTLADSRRPVLLFETSLPTRFYLPAEDVDLTGLSATDNHSHCPYKGVADGYWDVPENPALRNVAWSYSTPFPAVASIAGLVAFYNELVDITVDGHAQTRPVSHFSPPANRPGS